MIRSVIAAMACMAALSGFLGWRVHSLTGANAQLHQANTALSGQVTSLQKLRESEQRLAEQYAEQVKLLKEQQRKSDVALDKAVRQNPSWSDQRVPSSVVDALGL